MRKLYAIGPLDHAMNRCGAFLFLVTLANGCVHRSATDFDAHLFAAMRTIVQSDWQTSGIWDSRQSRTPPDSAVREVIQKCSFQWVDLDGDGRLEVIVQVSYSPGQKGNSSIYVLEHGGSDWHTIGELGGRSYEFEARQGGYPDIRTDWYGGGGKYITATYQFAGREYKLAKEDISEPQEDAK